MARMRGLVDHRINGFCSIHIDKKRNRGGSKHKKLVNTRGMHACTHTNIYVMHEFYYSE